MLSLGRSTNRLKPMPERLVIVLPVRPLLKYKLNSRPSKLWEPSLRAGLLLSNASLAVPLVKPQ